MSSHSNAEIKKHIDSNSDLIEKMSGLTKQLQGQLLGDFEATMGIPLPSAVEADVRELEYNMVYSTDPIIHEYMSGAKTLLDGAIAEDWPAVANKALDVVQVLLENVVGSSSIQTGAKSESMKIRADGKDGEHGVYISAAFTQIEECSAKDWLTETNFYVAFYAFVLWQPTPEHLDAIERNVPALA